MSHPIRFGTVLGEHSPDMRIGNLRMMVLGRSSRKMGFRNSDLISLLVLSGHCWGTHGPGSIVEISEVWATGTGPFSSVSVVEEALIVENGPEPRTTA